jgi:hypothetical protein
MVDGVAAAVADADREPFQLNEWVGAPRSADASMGRPTQPRALAFPRWQGLAGGAGPASFERAAPSMTGPRWQFYLGRAQTAVRGCVRLSAGFG